MGALHRVVVHTRSVLRDAPQICLCWLLLYGFLASLLAFIAQKCTFLAWLTLIIGSKPKI